MNPNSTLSEIQRFRTATTLMTILLSGKEDLFGENVLACLRSLGKVLSTLSSQMAVSSLQLSTNNEEGFLSVEGMMDLLGICRGRNAMF